MKTLAKNTQNNTNLEEENTMNKVFEMEINKLKDELLKERVIMTENKFAGLVDLMEVDFGAEETNVEKGEVIDMNNSFDDFVETVEKKFNEEDVTEKVASENLSVNVVYRPILNKEVHVPFRNRTAPITIYELESDFVTGKIGPMTFYWRTATHAEPYVVRDQTNLTSAQAQAVVKEVLASYKNFIMVIVTEEITEPIEVRLYAATALRVRRCLEENNVEEAKEGLIDLYDLVQKHGFHYPDFEELTQKVYEMDLVNA